MVDLRFSSTEQMVPALMLPLYIQQGFRVASFEGVFFLYRSDESSRLG